ncbi:MAG TPA: aminotransferase class I/II-fold pyridoxal phosphate-dependent enzyme [Xanthobacteraceae bacterium]|jgi:aspartate/methionine/tyrosine aminotransferase|nr:aminotransferase class I/II-fold pyridoxal phosphate-dependent enzyme [Xanthobacteraceae bacterium]
MSNVPADPDPSSAARTTRSPFIRLTELITGIEPGKPAINLTVGEPQHPIPPFVGETVNRTLKEFGRYPPTKGTERVRRAAASWLENRFALPRPVDIESELLVLNGTREGLFLAALTAKEIVPPRTGRPAILVPNPFYAAYVAGAVAAGCEPVFLPATKDNGFLPDLDALDDALLTRTVAIYFGSPSNPQGSVADLAYLKRLVGMARKHGFLIFSDECYSEIYTRDKPPGMLEATGADFANVIVFNSLSKRSNLPGARVGIAAGEKRFMLKFLDYRNVVAPQVPGPLQEVAAAAYSDEAHVEENRRLYRLKFDLADQIIGDRYGYTRPAGGFFLWLDVSKYGGSEKVAVKLWQEAGVRILPGGYLAHNQADGSNPGADFIRVAMVQDQDITAEALHRIVATLD